MLFRSHGGAGVGIDDDGFLLIAGQRLGEDAAEHGLAAAGAAPDCNRFGHWDSSWFQFASVGPAPGIRDCFTRKVCIHKSIWVMDVQMVFCLLLLFSGWTYDLCSQSELEAALSAGDSEESGLPSLSVSESPAAGGVPALPEASALL